MYVLSIAVFVFAVCTTQGLQPGHNDRVKECVELHQVDGKESDIETSFGETGAVLDENNLAQKCYVKCLGDGTGVFRDAEDKMDVDRMMTEPNSIVFEVMPANVSGERLTREQFRGEIEDCAKIDEADRCETGYKQMQCVRVLSRKIYKMIVQLNTSHNMTTPAVP